MLHKLTIGCLLLFTGFMYGTIVLDKDGVTAAVVMAEMAAYLQRQGLTLNDQLNKLHERCVCTFSFAFFGVVDLPDEQICDIGRFHTRRRTSRLDGQIV